MSLSLLLVALLACNKDEAPTGELSSCDPLDPSICALPYPSSHYLREADTPTGYQVTFAADSLPINRDLVRIDPKYFNEKDGFATTGPIMTWFADLSLAGVVSHVNLDDYTAADAKVVLLDAETGERVPVWAELDMTAAEDTERLFTIWPAVKLDHAKRYVVALRGLEKTTGGSVDVSPAFQALRDGAESDLADVELRREHFEANVFAPLEAAGIARGDLQLAWDFVTVSRENSLGRMEFIRDDAFSRMGEDGPDYAEPEVTDFDCSVEGEHIARDVEIMMQIPMYTESAGPNTVLTRDEAGQPYFNGYREVEVLVRIPCSVAEAAQPAFVLNYGHGMLGNKEEVYAGWLERYADENGWVVVATTWTGMSAEDVGPISFTMVTQPGDFAIIPERSFQGYLEAMAALRLVTNGAKDDAAFQFDAGSGPTSVIDPDRIGYYGISQGGIMGGALVAMSPDLERGVLGVPGAPYALLLWRSKNFDPFFDLFKAKFEDHREISMFMAMMETLWEPAEAAGWLHEMGDKRILLQPAISDAQVTTLGAQYMARNYGAKTIAPQTRPIWGVEEVAGPHEGSAIVEFLYPDMPAEPTDNHPFGEEIDTHECPRREPAGQAQVRTFLETGAVHQYCDGVCDDSNAVGLCL